MTRESTANADSCASKPRFATTSLQIIVCFLLIAAVGLAVGRTLAPHGAWYKAGGVWDQLLSWDGGWYLNIAIDGYRWDPAVGAAAQQNIAFFPLQALVDRVAIEVAGVNPFRLIECLSLASGIVSIVYFNKLAEILVGDAARSATALYALWPASSFYLMGYPTGIISICVVGALRAHVENRNWRSALWLGLGSAAAPTVVFVAAALGAHHLLRWWKSGHALPALFWTGAWGLMAVSGLLLFVGYQAGAFHDPFAFLKAQAAWGESPGLVKQMANLARPLRYLRQARVGLHEIAGGSVLIHGGQVDAGANQMQMGVQRLVNLATLIAALVGLVSASFALRGERAVIAWSGWTAFVGYLWFIVATAQNVQSTPRLTFPALALFLGLGVLVHRAPRIVEVILIALFAATSCAEIAFAAAGYWVV